MRLAASAAARNLELFVVRLPEHVQPSQFLKPQGVFQGGRAPLSAHAGHPRVLRWLCGPRRRRQTVGAGAAASSGGVFWQCMCVSLASAISFGAGASTKAQRVPLLFSSFSQVLLMCPCRGGCIFEKELLEIFRGDDDEGSCSHEPPAITASCPLPDGVELAYRKCSRRCSHFDVHGKHGSKQ